MANVCVNCGAMKWKTEAPGMCCPPGPSQAFELVLYIIRERSGTPSSVCPHVCLLRADRHHAVSDHRETRWAGRDRESETNGRVGFRLDRRASRACAISRVTRTFRRSRCTQSPRCLVCFWTVDRLAVD